MPTVKGLLDKYFWRQKPDEPPPITTNTAAALLILYTLIYVVPFYLSAKTRPSPHTSRDAPSVIRARITSVTLTCIVCSALTVYILTRDGHATVADAAHLMGYWPAGLPETGRALLLTAGLFAGPLFEHLVVDAGWRAWTDLSPLKGLLSEWTTWRNIVAGPVTEEILFRSAAVPLMLLARTPIRTTIFLSPVLFGLAHIHHFYEFRITHGHVPVVVALARSLFQLAYTTLFGAFATFLFLRSGSLLAICLVHAFCNCMGLPRVWGRVRPWSAEEPAPAPPAPAGGAGSAGASAGGASPAGDASVLWTVAYYVLLVGGAVFWYRNLWALTESPHALVQMG